LLEFPQPSFIEVQAWLVFLFELFLMQLLFAELLRELLFELLASIKLLIWLFLQLLFSFLLLPETSSQLLFLPDFTSQSLL
jgi:hypothetical protein